MAQTAADREPRCTISPMKVGEVLHESIRPSKIQVGASDKQVFSSQTTSSRDLIIGNSTPNDSDPPLNNSSSSELSCFASAVNWLTSPGKIMVICWIVLAIVTLSQASIGPSFKYIMVEWKLAPALAAVWRNQIICLVMLPPAIIEFVRTSVETRWEWWRSTIPDEDNPSQSYHISTYILIICLVWTTNLFMFILSLEYTTTVRSQLFSNTGPLILMLYYRYARHVQHSSGEFGGVFVAVIGLTMAMLDAKPDQLSGSSGKSWLGDLLCVGVAVLLSVNIVLIGRARQILPLFVYCWLTVTVHTIMLSIYSIIAEGSTLSMGTHGIWGWMQPAYVATIFTFGAFNGIFGIAGRNFCLKYMDGVVLSTVALLSPAITGVISFLAGLEGVPKVWTMIGGTLVIIGIILVAAYEHKRKLQEKAAAQRSPVSAFEAKSFSLELAEDTRVIESTFIEHQHILPSISMQSTLDDDINEFSVHDFSFPNQQPDTTTSETEPETDPSIGGLAVVAIESQALSASTLAMQQRQ